MRDARGLRNPQFVDRKKRIGIQYSDILHYDIEALELRTQDRKHYYHIRHAESSDSVKTKVNDKGKVSRKRRYLIDIDGDFGAVRFCFMSKGKRDQLYSALVVANHMGRPVNLN